LGQCNSIKSVALGYAFNYVIPQNLAEIATEGKIQHLMMLNKNKNKQEEQMYRRNMYIKNKLENISKINIRKKIGHNGQIFGSIIENEIIQEVYRLTQQSLSKRNLQIPSIKQSGQYEVKITISNTLYTFIQLYIIPSTI